MTTAVFHIVERLEYINNIESWRYFTTFQFNVDLYHSSSRNALMYQVHGSVQLHQHFKTHTYRIIHANMRTSDIITPSISVAFVYNGPKGMELAPNPHYSGGS